MVEFFSERLTHFRDFEATEIVNLSGTTVNRYIWFSRYDLKNYTGDSPVVIKFEYVSKFYVSNLFL